MTETTRLIENIKDTSEIKKIIHEAKSKASLQCDATNGHKQCITVSDNLPIPNCPNGLHHILISILASQPKLVDEQIRAEVCDYFKSAKIEASGLISLDHLTTLNSTRSPTNTWLGYELLLISLIKCRAYDSKAVANEIMAIVETEMRPEIATKFSSVMSSCVKYCRETSGQTNKDEEEEEKWCEIIDWMSWFIGNPGD